MRENQRQRQKILGFIGCVSVYRSLIARAKHFCVTVAGFQRVIHAVCDVFTLTVNQDLESEVFGVVTDILDGFLCRFENDPVLVDDAHETDLTGNDDIAFGRHHFARNSRVSVEFQTPVEDAVGDIIAQFVGVSHTYAFCCFKLFHISPFKWKSTRRCFYWLIFISCGPGTSVTTAPMVQSSARQILSRTSE